MIHKHFRKNDARTLKWYKSHYLGAGTIILTEAQVVRLSPVPKFDLV